MGGNPSARALIKCNRHGGVRNAREMDANTSCNQMNAHQQPGIDLESWGLKQYIMSTTCIFMYFLGIPTKHVDGKNLTPKSHPATISCCFDPVLSPASSEVAILFVTKLNLKASSVLK